MVTRQKVVLASSFFVFRERKNNMKTIEELLQEATQKIQDVKDSSSLNDLRVLYLGKKGPVQELMKGMKDLSKEEKPIFGQKVNQLKQDLSKMIGGFRNAKKD